MVLEQSALDVREGACTALGKNTVPEEGLEPSVSYLGGKRLIH